jgi:xanthine dehydrogenase large subunit
MPDDDLPETGALAVVSKPLPHDSARLHVTGAATYVDDIREPAGTLHIAQMATSRADVCASWISSRAVRRAWSRTTAADIPGRNDIAGGGDEPVFASGNVMFHGQPMFAVGGTRDAFRRAPRRRRDRSGDRSLIRGCDRGGGKVFDYAGRGDAEAGAGTQHRLEGQLAIGGQDTSTSRARSPRDPRRRGQLTIVSSTQDPAEVHTSWRACWACRRHGW